MEHRLFRIGLASFAFVALCVAPSFPSAQEGFAGTWRVDGVGVSLPWEVVLRPDGPGVNGVVSRCANDATDIYEGRINGNTVVFKCQNGDRSRTVSFTGRLEGDEIALQWELQLAPGGIPVGDANRMFGPLAPRRVIAKRVPDGGLAASFDAMPGVELAAAVNLLQSDMKVEGRLFLPEKAGLIRAVIVAIGWGRGFDFYEDPQVRKLLHTAQSALLLARLTSVSTRLSYGFALDAAAGGGDALFRLLVRFAQESGHQELAQVPLLFWGHSGGGSFGPSFAVLHPQRTIAFVQYQGNSPRPDAVVVLSRVPALIFTNSGGTEPAATIWKSGRVSGAPWTFAMQRDAPHGDLDYLKKANDLTIPWIAAVLRQRLSPEAGRLKVLSDASGWLGNNETGEVASHDAYSGSKREASWLPDEASARGWRSVTGIIK
jgi:pimeloyl-ACP methyl ester carboxylesterase